MKLSLRTTAASDPTKSNYEIFERDVSTDEAFELLGRLASPQDIIYLETSTGSLDLWKHEGSLWVEVYRDELWATSEVNSDEARCIIEMLERDDAFCNCKPFTNREWDAYAPLGDNVSVQKDAT
jgi:hypothetical protein